MKLSIIKVFLSHLQKLLEIALAKTLETADIDRYIRETEASKTRLVRQRNKYRSLEGSFEEIRARAEGARKKLLDREQIERLSGELEALRNAGNEVKDSFA